MTPHERRLQSYDTKIQKATKEGDTDEVQRLQAGKQNYLQVMLGGSRLGSCVANKTQRDQRNP